MTHAICPECETVAHCTNHGCIPKTPEEFTLSVTDLIEHEDGSATFTFDMDRKTTQFLVQYAILSILKKAAEETKEREK